MPCCACLTYARPHTSACLAFPLHASSTCRSMKRMVISVQAAQLLGPHHRAAGRAGGRGGDDGEEDCVGAWGACGRVSSIGLSVACSVAQSPCHPSAPAAPNPTRTTATSSCLPPLSQVRKLDGKSASVEQRTETNLKVIFGGPLRIAWHCGQPTSGQRAVHSQPNEHAGTLQSKQLECVNSPAHPLPSSPPRTGEGAVHGGREAGSHHLGRILNRHQPAGLTLVAIIWLQAMLAAVVVAEHTQLRQRCAALAAG